ncbi:MAG: dienelactone hydrolase family protein [Clostridia bacterium]|nr:dienelactone hydrolase family protein [Clostridia bacterium]
MEKKYYTEEVVRFSPWREEYQQSIGEYLESEKEKAEGKRSQFISPEAYKADMGGYRKKLIDMLGYPLNGKRETPELLKKEFVAQDGNVNIYRMQLLFFGKLKFYGIYFEQIKDKESAPFCIVQHGGGDSAEVISSMYGPNETYQDLTRRITDRGANAFAPQLLLWRDDPYGSTHDRLATDGKLRQIGGSITALELYLMRGSIDYFVENEGINAERLGVAGLSYGGMYALHLAAVDDRIKACYSCSWVNDCYIHSREDWSYFNAQNTFTVAETAAMIAPRPLVVGMGDKDNLFNLAVTEKECDRIEKYYAAFGATDRFKRDFFDGYHQVDPADDSIEFLMLHL